MDMKLISACSKAFEQQMSCRICPPVGSMLISLQHVPLWYSMLGCGRMLARDIDTVKLQMGHHTAFLYQSAQVHDMLYDLDREMSKAAVDSLAAVSQDAIALQKVVPLAAVEGIAACWISIDLQGLVDSHMASIQPDSIVLVGQGKPTPYQ